MGFSLAKLELQEKIIMVADPVSSLDLPLFRTT